MTVAPKKAAKSPAQAKAALAFAAGGRAAQVYGWRIIAELHRGVHRSALHAVP